MRKIEVKCIQNINQNFEEFYISHIQRELILIVISQLRIYLVTENDHKRWWAYL